MSTSREDEIPRRCACGISGPPAGVRATMQQPTTCPFPFSAVGANHDLEVSGLTDPLEVVVVVGEVLLGERELHLGRCAGFQVHFAEAFECLRIESITSD